MTQDDRMYLMLGTVDAIVRDLRSMAGAEVACHLAAMLMQEILTLNHAADLDHPETQSAHPDQLHHPAQAAQ